MLAFVGAKPLKSQYLPLISSTLGVGLLEKKGFRDRSRGHGNYRFNAITPKKCRTVTKIVHLGTRQVPTIGVMFFRGVSVLDTVKVEGSLTFLDF